jgi:integrase
MAQGLAPTTIRDIQGIVRMYLKPFLGSIDMRTLKTYHVQDFQHSIKDKHPKTQRNILTYLRNFTHWLYKREIIDRVPVFDTPRYDKKPIGYINHEEQLRVLSFVPDAEKAIVTFMVYHPVRVGEALALRVKDIDFERNSITVSRAFSLGIERSRKTHDYYTLWLSNDCIDVVKDACKDKLPDAYVFTKDGAVFSGEHIRRVWKRACKKAGISIELKNGTRHSGATQAINSGVPLEVVSKALGHSSIVTTMKNYAHIEYVNTKAVVEKIQPRSIPNEENESATG